MPDESNNRIVAQAEPATAWVGPLSFHVLAEDYFRGGNAALPGPSDKRSLSCYNMLCQAVELALKAFLRLKGVARDDLRKQFGHDLVKLLDRAKTEGLLSVAVLTADQESAIEEANTYYRTKLFEYPDDLLAMLKNYPDKPDATRLRDAAAVLVERLERPCLNATNTPPR